MDVRLKQKPIKINKNPEIFSLFQTQWPWLLECLAGWLAGWLADWLAGWLSGLLLAACLAGWLLADWLAS